FEVQSKVPLFKRAQGYGFEGFAVDGNDPIATAAVMDHAVITHVVAGDQSWLKRTPIAWALTQQRTTPRNTAPAKKKPSTPNPLRWCALNSICVVVSTTLMRSLMKSRPKASN